jgi:hypothetical protein
MEDKLDEITNMHLKPKISYYINSLLIKITIILLLLLVLTMDSIFE